MVKCQNYVEFGMNAPEPQPYRSDKSKSIFMIVKKISFTATLKKIHLSKKEQLENLIEYSVSNQPLSYK